MSVDCESCGVVIPSTRATARVKLRGRTGYFCCEACRRTFHEHPDLFPDARLVETVTSTTAS